jgi:penicillin-binding protein 2
LKYKKEHIDILLSGMNDVVNSPNGTAYRSHSEELEFGGKTGSSQVRRITEQQRKERKTTSDEYLEKEHAVFVGYAPVSEPRIAVCVLIEHGGSGARTAAPMARDILLKASEIV